MSEPPVQATYNPAVFATADEAAARGVILTPVGPQTTEARWATETPYLARLIAERLDLRGGETLLDYGCGVGRLAKALIEARGVKVVGVDISEEMRSLAPRYVGSSDFAAISRRMLKALVEKGFRADAAISVWVLQHCAQPLDDIELLASALTPGAQLMVVNTRARAVPTLEIPWADDGLDVAGLLAARLSPLEVGVLDSKVVGETIAKGAFWGRYRA